MRLYTFLYKCVACIHNTETTPAQAVETQTTAASVTENATEAAKEAEDKKYKIFLHAKYT
jgi:hypothetical protein